MRVEWADEWIAARASYRVVQLLTPGALYLGDDLLPQPTWRHDHQQRVDAFLDRLVHERGIRPVVMGWASGLVAGARI